MIKATGRTGDGDILLMLGLSRANTERLLTGQPIKINGLDVGLPGIQVVLIGGETEETIAQQMHDNGLISSDALRQELHPEGGTSDG